MSKEGQGKAKARSRRGQGKVMVRSRQRKHNLNRNYHLKGFDTIEINLVIHYKPTCKIMPLDCFCMIVLSKWPKIAKDKLTKMVKDSLRIVS